MHPSAQKFFAMTSAQKLQVHIFLANVALEQWNSFVASGLVPMSYQETVTGTCQEVDETLPSDALACVAEGTDSATISERYREPVCAYRDEDWRLSDDPEFAYLAIYNTFQKYALNKDVDDWLIVNQTLSCLGENSDRIESVLEAALNAA